MMFSVNSAWKAWKSTVCCTDQCRSADNGGIAGMEEHGEEKSEATDPLVASWWHLHGCSHLVGWHTFNTHSLT